MLRAVEFYEKCGFAVIYGGIYEAVQVKHEVQGVMRRISLLFLFTFGVGRPVHLSRCHSDSLCHSLGIGSKEFATQSRCEFISSEMCHLCGPALESRLGWDYHPTWAA